ncbi:MAG: putative zinc-binding protein [Planctomycetes bacterium]|nr:putative zinc-binding protein [Planctomycetota bacterium]MBL7106038.1 putative zinc-binding protein [Phycisphaerae bacterium]
MSGNETGSVCDPASKLIFSCSGAADVGEISDRTARKLTKEGAGKMFCMAGVAGKVGAIVEATKSASQILVVDGCGVDCVKKCLENAGFENFQHIRITDMGMEKGKTAVTEENITNAAEKAGKLLS